MAEVLHFSANHPRQAQQPSPKPSASLHSSVESALGLPGAEALAVQRAPRSSPLARPSTAPQLRTPEAEPPVVPKAPRTKFGRVNLFEDQQHAILGPQVLRDFVKPVRGLPLRGPDDFLAKGQGKSLHSRVALKHHIKRNPIDRDPPFVAGNGSLRLSFADLPGRPNTMFRRLYDSSTIDFVAVHCTGMTNAVRWARPAARGQKMWGDRPSEIEIGRWLPIFLDGIREFEEPYRFLAIRGSEDLIDEAGTRLANMAAEMVAPFKAALDTREPTTVAVALQIMIRILDEAPQVAQTWIYALPPWLRVLNAFQTRKLEVDMGYNCRTQTSIKALTLQLLERLNASGGDGATATIRRHATGFDPLPPRR